MAPPPAGAGAHAGQAPGGGRQGGGLIQWTPTDVETISVWAHNVEEELDRIQDVVEVFRHVAIDAQFSGIVAKPTGPFSDYADYNYQTLKCNVDLTSALWISMSFRDERGQRPEGACTWRFHFRFDTRRDVLSQDTDTRGIDLQRHAQEGIVPEYFAELLTCSGLVLNEDIRWITYGETSGFSEPPAECGANGRPRESPRETHCGLYDFGHLLQLLTSLPLPNEVTGFLEYLDLFFPRRCDISKHADRLALVGDAARKRTFFRKSHHLLQAFFHLPEAVRRSAFDEGGDAPDSPSEDAPQPLAEAPAGTPTADEKPRPRRPHRGRDRQKARAAQLRN